MSAQIGGSGSIQGTVLDNGRRAGRDSHRDQPRHGRRDDALTTGAGVYAVSPLPPGVYRVEVTLDGFQTSRESVIVDALAVVGLNVTLQVSGVARR